MYRTGRNWRALNPENFIGDVCATDWTTVVRQDDPCERQWERFSTEMNRILDIHVPVRRFRVHNPSPPPVSDDTLDLMQQRREAKNSGNTDLYNELNATVKRAIRDDCRNTISQRVINSHPSTLYRQFQPIISSKRGSSTQPVNLTPDELNTYFTSIGTETRDKVMTQFSQSGREPLSVRLPRVNAGALNIVPVTLDHLQRILSSLPNKSSCVEGDIPLNVLKLTFEVTGRSLLRIINKSIATETVPPLGRVL